MKNIDWDAVRAEYEGVGKSQSALAKKYGVSRKAIQNHIATEGWQRDISQALQTATDVKVAGVVAGCDPKKKQKAIDAESTKRAAVTVRHRAEWDDHETLVNRAIKERDFDVAKLAKITAEALKIRQEG